MAKDEIIELPDGTQCVSTSTAAKRLNVIRRRVLQFIEAGALRSVQFRPGGEHYVLLESLNDFEKLERKPGRPTKKKKAPAKRRAKKSEKQ